MLTDPKKFQPSAELQAICSYIATPSWMRLIADFRIDKWAEHDDEQLVIHNDVLLGMQARAEVWYVEDLFAVYFFSGSMESILQRFEEFWEDQKAA